MFLLSLDIQNFRALREAHLTFGRGLNILYGPNDLGKSTLAEALRVAFLLPATSSACRDFVPWGTNFVPRVVVKFEMNGVVWQITKAFGTGAQANSLLERVGESGRLFEEARERNVERRLREIIAWGVPAPGGKGAPRGLPESYLATALLGRQDAVTAILEASPDQDGDNSGLELVTRALGTLGQDPLVRQLLQRLQEVTERVFTETGLFRRAEDSPLVQLNNKVRDQKVRVDQLEESVRQSGEIERRVQSLTEHKILADEECSRLQRRVELLRRVRKVEDELERVRHREQSMEEARRVLAGIEKDLRVIESRYEQATTSLRKVEEELRTSGERLAKILGSQEKVRENAQEAREARGNELIAKRDGAARQVQAAQEVIQAQAQEQVRERELAQAEVEFKRAQQAKLDAQNLAALASLLAEQKKANAVVEALRVAESARDDRAAHVDQAETALKKAEASLLEAEGTVTLQMDALAATKREVGERELRKETLRARLNGAETAEREAEREVLQGVARVNASIAWSERLAEAEKSLPVLAADERGLEVALAANTAQKQACEDRQSELRSRARNRVQDLRLRAKKVREQVGSLEERLASKSLPTIDRITAFQALEKANLQCRNTEPSVVAVPIRPALLGALLFGATTATTLGFGLRVHGLLVLVATLGCGVVAAVVTAITLRHWRFREALRVWHLEFDDLTKRWTNEVEPVLRAAGVSDLPALENVCRVDVAERRESARLRAEADKLETEAEADRVSFDLNDLKEQRKLEDLMKARQDLLEKRNQVSAKRGAAQTRVESVRSERDQTVTIIGETDVDLEQAKLRLFEARTEVERIQREFAALEDFKPPPGAVTSAQVEAAERAVRVQKEQVSEGRRILDQARHELAKAQARMEAAASSAASVNLFDLEKRVNSARKETGAEAALRAPDPAEAQTNVERARQTSAKLDTAMKVARERLSDARSRSEGLAAKLKQPADQVLAEAEKERKGADKALEDLKETSFTEVAAAEKEFQEAQAEVTRLKGDLKAARTQAEVATQARDKSRTKRDESQGKLEALRQSVPGTNVEGIEAALAQAHQELELCPGSEDLTEAEARLEQQLAQSQRTERDLNEARGQLRLVGGIVAREQRDRDFEALEALKKCAGDLELEYRATKRLLDVLKEEEMRHAAHLGQSLAKPVTAIFSEFTSGRYAQIVLDPGLRFESVMAKGGERDLASLSVGTRDQLATLVRLALAAHLKCAIVLDDQLTHSDPRCLAWFRDRLRTSVREHGHQIIVLTCRPLDYLHPEEMPGPTCDTLGTEDGRLAVVDVERVASCG